MARRAPSFILRYVWSVSSAATRIAPIIVFGASLLGCALPGAGADARSILEQRGWANQSFAVVHVAPAVLDTLALRRPPSLAARFGGKRRVPDMRIVPGDLVTVSLWEAPPGTLFGAPSNAERFASTSGNVTVPTQSVGNDGTIRVPYAGRIPVVGERASDVEHEITAALANKTVQPQALVEVKQSALNAVTVTGEVAGGARVPVTAGGQRVLDVIAAAGGLRVPVKESIVEVTRGSVSARAAFEDVVNDPRENVFVLPGDTVTVIREPHSFTVLGATTRNAEIAFDAAHVSMGEALALAGGLEDNRADAAGVFVFRLEPYAVARRLLDPDCPLLNPHGMTPVVYHFNLLDPVVLGMLNHFWVEPNDLVYVANASGAETAKFFNIAQGVVGNTLTAGAIAVTATRF
jgi:polysaccharide export outer membrane protein